jgi:hypothetical protein
MDLAHIDGNDRHFTLAGRCWNLRILSCVNIGCIVGPRGRIQTTRGVMSLMQAVRSHDVDGMYCHDVHEDGRGRPAEHPSIVGTGQAGCRDGGSARSGKVVSRTGT